MGLLDRFLGRANAKQGSTVDLAPETAQKIVQDYGAVLGSSAPAPGCVADARFLPHSKERIKQALQFALRVTKEPQMKEHLKSAYISLADWQEGVGSEQIGIDVTNLDPSMDTLEAAKQIASQGNAMKKWHLTIEAEQQALAAELRELGLW